MALNEEKHPNQRWKTMTPDEHVGAVLRHALKWLSGERLDPETGKSHLTHALCRNAMAVDQEDTEKSSDTETDDIKALMEYASTDEWKWPMVSPDIARKGEEDNGFACDRIRYTHIEEAPLAAPVQAEYEAWIDGHLETGLNSSFVYDYPHYNSIDDFPPSDWDKANATFLSEHQTRYAAAVSKQTNGDDE